MRNILISAAAAAVLTVGAGAAPAAAEPVRLDRAPAASADLQLIPAQYHRGRGNDWRRYCYRGERVNECRHRLRDQQRYSRYDRRPDPRYRGYSRYDNDGNVGAAVALAILGTALGVNIVGDTRDRDHYHRYRNDRRWHDWCRSRYRSYDYRSGTYLHRDGYRRYCRRY